MSDSDAQGTIRAVRGSRLGLLLRNMALQDWVCLAFHGHMFLRVLFAQDSEEAAFARRYAFILLAVTALAVALARGELLPKGRLRAVVYRVGIFAPVVLSYFELRALLTSLDLTMLDPQLEAVDRALFGTPPSVWLQWLNQPASIEWFSFFYFSYFTLLSLVLLPSLFFDRGQRLRELMVGAMTVVTVGHTFYMIVPALGPHVAYPFEEPIHGGFFWGLVEDAVVNAGAQMDLFPSLHTALPTYLTLHCFGHRRAMPFKVVWPVLGFFAANIIVATMLLRWHWGIDVVCGLLLAATARLIAVHVARREAGRGIEDDRQPVWEHLFGRAEPPAPGPAEGG